jgi:two-component system, LytTR family, response regulator
MARLRALIADDEPLARARLSRLLAQFPDVTVVADCANGGEAISAIQAQRPDIAFLDIQMPDIDGFDVLGALPQTVHPKVVFVSAYSEHAVRAFQARALDYLLKPVSAERLREAVDRVQRPRPNDAPASREFASRLAVPVGVRIHLVPVEDIDYITAHGNYVELHLGARALVLRETMTHLESRLDPRQFLRVHRSRLVRLDRVVDAEGHATGQFLLRLKSGVRLSTGRSYQTRIRLALGLDGSD